MKDLNLRAYKRPIPLAGAPLQPNLSNAPKGDRWDLNPQQVDPQSTALPIELRSQWDKMDSNHRPSPYQRDTLTNCATVPNGTGWN